MPQKTKYDLKDFRELVLAGKSKGEIMKELGIKNHPTFTNMRLKLMDEDKKYYQMSESEKVKETKPTVIKIGKNQTLTLSSKALSSSGFKVGDTFTVKFFKNRINLTLVGKK